MAARLFITIGSLGLLRSPLLSLRCFFSPSFGAAEVVVVGSLSSFFSSVSFFGFSVTVDSVLFVGLTSHPRFSTGLDVSTFVCVVGDTVLFSLSLGSVFFDKFNLGRSPLLLLLLFGLDTGAPRPQAPAAPLFCLLY